MGKYFINLNTNSLNVETLHNRNTSRPKGRLWNARWQQTYQINIHCLRSSEYAHITENNGFYLVSLLPQSILKVPYSQLSTKRN